MASKKSRKTEEPMDPGAKERLTPDPIQNRARTAKALRTLISEVLEVFPETPHEVSGANGWATALDVTFDVSGLVSEDRDDLLTVLNLIAESDHRVLGVYYEDDHALISLENNPKVYDTQTPFMFGPAWGALRNPASPEPEPESEPESEPDPEQGEGEVQ